MIGSGDSDGGGDECCIVGVLSVGDVRAGLRIWSSIRSSIYNRQRHIRAFLIDCLFWALVLIGMAPLFVQCKQAGVRLRTNMTSVGD